MVTNPYREQYRALIDNSPDTAAERADAFGDLMVDLYYALDEALGRIYELEQTLEGKAQQEEEARLFIE